MKTFKSLFIISVCLFSISLFAEEKNEGQKGKGVKGCFDRFIERMNANPPDTLVDITDTTHSGYGAPYVKFTTIGGKLGVLVGGQGGWIINDSFVIGGGGCGLTTDHKKKAITADHDPDDLSLALGYGGMRLEYHIFPKKLIHFSIGTLVGAGGYTLYERGHRRDYEDEDEFREAESFFILEPELNMFLNITRFLRLGIGGSYRYVNGVSNYGLENKDLMDYSGQVSLQFGWF